MLNKPMFCLDNYKIPKRSFVMLHFGLNLHPFNKRIHVDCKCRFATLFSSIIKMFS